MEREQLVIGVCMRCGTTATDIEGGGLFPGLLVCPDCKAKELKETEKQFNNMTGR